MPSVRAFRPSLSATLALALVLLAELVVRAAEPVLAQPLQWGSYETQNKVNRINALTKAGGAATVFIGSSMMSTDFDPHQFDLLTASTRPTFNAALDGSDPRTWEPWTLGVVVPRLRPRTVVIGVSSRELNDRGLNQRSFYDTFRNSPLGKYTVHHDSIVLRTQRWVESSSYLVKYRSVLRDPARTFSHDFGLRSEPSDRLGVSLEVASQQDGTFVNSAAFRAEHKGRVFNDYSAGAAETSALDRLIFRLQKKGIAVLVVKMPLTKDILDIQPHGARDMDAFLHALESVVARRQVEVLDMDIAIQDIGLFRDPLHLNLKGRAAFTTLISGRVRP